MKPLIGLLLMCYSALAVDPHYYGDATGLTNLNGSNNFIGPIVLNVGSTNWFGGYNGITNLANSGANSGLFLESTGSGLTWAAAAGGASVTHSVLTAGFNPASLAGASTINANAQYALPPSSDGSYFYGSTSNYAGLFAAPFAGHLTNMLCSWSEISDAGGLTGTNILLGVCTNGFLAHISPIRIGANFGSTVYVTNNGWSEPIAMGETIYFVLVNTNALPGGFMAKEGFRISCDFITP